MRLDYSHSTAQSSPLQGPANNGLYDNTLPGLPVVNACRRAPGCDSTDVDLSVYANNITNFRSVRCSKLATLHALGGPTTDDLYFARGVTPRTLGLTALYRYLRDNKEGAAFAAGGTRPFRLQIMRTFGVTDLSKQ